MLMTSAHDGRKGFIVAEQQLCIVKGRKIREYFTNTDMHWPSQLSMWNCGHGVATRDIVVSFFCFVAGQNQPENLAKFFLRIMTSEKEIPYAELFLTAEIDSSESFCSHMCCAYAHRTSAECSRNLAVMTVMSLTHFYNTYHLDIEMPEEPNTDYSKNNFSIN